MHCCQMLTAVAHMPLSAASTPVLHSLRQPATVDADRDDDDDDDDEIGPADSDDAASVVVSVARVDAVDDDADTGAPDSVDDVTVRAVAASTDGGAAAATLAPGRRVNTTSGSCIIRKRMSHARSGTSTAASGRSTSAAFKFPAARLHGPRATPPPTLTA